MRRLQVCAIAAAALAAWLLPSAVPAGSASSGPSENVSLSSPFFTFGRHTYFIASDAEHGQELWRTDGTPAGTRLHFDACPGPCDGNPALMLGDQSLLFFANPADWPSSQALFRIEGNGAVALTGEAFGQVPPFVPGLMDPVSRIVSFFSWSPRSAPEVEIWHTDGTPGGTSRWRPELLPADYPFAGAAGGIFFAVRSSPAPVLWKSNGTPNGTGPLHVEGRTLEDPQQLATVGKRLLAFGHDADQLGLRAAVSDGTDGGSKWLPALHGPQGLAWARLHRLGPRLLVAGARRGEGHALWATNGTNAGTKLLVTFDNPEAFGDPFDFFFTIPAPGSIETGRTFFVANETGYGAEVWSSNGTAAGTRLALDACPGPCSSAPRVLAKLNGRAMVEATAPGGAVRILSTAGDPASVQVAGTLCSTQCTGLFTVTFEDGDRQLLLVSRPGRPLESWETRGRSGDLRRLRVLPTDALPSHGYGFLPATDSLIFGGPVDGDPYALSLQTGKLVRLKKLQD